jgi:hypothetical protein
MVPASHTKWLASRIPDCEVRNIRQSGEGHEIPGSCFVAAFRQNAASIPVWRPLRSRARRSAKTPLRIEPLDFDGRLIARRIPGLLHQHFNDRHHQPGQQAETNAAVEPPDR